MTTTSVHQRQDIAAVLASAHDRTRVPQLLRWVIALAVLGVAVAGGVTALRSRSTGDATAAYVTEPVRRGDLDVRVSATGKLQPTNTVEVGSEQSGLVVGVFVQENDIVRKGQVLARLDTSKLQDALTKSEAVVASAEALLAETEATVKEATETLNRLQEVSRLSGGKVPSKTEMDTAEAKLARAIADRASQSAAVTQARAVLRSDRTNLAKASIYSPIDGIVLSRAVEPGQTVAAALQVTTLFKIAQDLRQMRLKVDIDEADVGRVKNGQRATFAVDAYPNRTYTADVIRVAYGSTTTGDVVSYSTLLNVHNDDLTLRPGMTASAEIATASIKNALLVPNAALRFTPATTATTTSGGGFLGSLFRGPRTTSQPQTTATADRTQRVWVLRDGGPVAVDVTVGETNGRYTQIVGGDLRQDAQVITDTTGGQS